MLTTGMQAIIRTYSAGMVATVNDDATPAVSPKATFVILDERTLAFGNIRSPGTLANLRDRPQIEVCFLDVLVRKAVRVRGTAEIIPKRKAGERLHRAFREAWNEYLPVMPAFVVIHLSAAEMILSPAYDLGYDEENLRQANLTNLNLN